MNQIKQSALRNLLISSAMMRNAFFEWIRNARISSRRCIYFIYSMGTACVTTTHNNLSASFFFLFSICCTWSLPYCMYLSMYYMSYLFFAFPTLYNSTCLNAAYVAIFSVCFYYGNSFTRRGSKQKKIVLAWISIKKIKFFVFQWFCCFFFFSLSLLILIWSQLCFFRNASDW